MPAPAREGRARRKGTSVILPQRWALRLTIEGDLRFLSHLDCVRAVERTAARAKAPLRFTQGFNPRPVLSLACARPVGVATRDDLVVMTLDEPVDAEMLLRRMNRCAPTGMRFDRPQPFGKSDKLRPRRMRYELALDDRLCSAVASRIEELGQADTWPVERLRPPKGRRRSGRRIAIDLKELVDSVALEGRTLRWTTRAKGDLWPRVDEVLSLLGLTCPEHAADVIRTAMICDP